MNTKNKSSCPITKSGFVAVLGFGTMAFLVMAADLLIPVYGETIQIDPRDLKGEDIPLAARVFSVIDVWDAVQSDRPYNHAWSKEDTIQYLREQSGKQFDPKCVDVFLGLAEQGNI